MVNLDTVWVHYGTLWEQYGTRLGYTEYGTGWGPNPRQSLTHDSPENDRDHCLMILSIHCQYPSLQDLSRSFATDNPGMDKGIQIWVSAIECWCVSGNCDICGCVCVFRQILWEGRGWGPHMCHTSAWTESQGSKRQEKLRYEAQKWCLTTKYMQQLRLQLLLCHGMPAAPHISVWMQHYPLHTFFCSCGSFFSYSSCLIIYI